MLKRVLIQNYRSCLSTSLEPHPALSVLIGPNSSGKTNILRGIMFLNKLAHEEEYSRTRPDAISVSSRIKATFETRRAHIQLNASVEAYTDESNDDVMVGSQQRWSLRGPSRQRISFALPLGLASGRTMQYLFAHPDVYRRVVRHSYGSVYRGVLRKLPAEPPAWAIRLMRKVADYCAGLRYYGASQFTNPGSCPVSFEIEPAERRRSLLRLRGHARLLYSMYSAQKADESGRYAQFIEIVGTKGLRLIDNLTFREVPTSATDYSVRAGGKIAVRKRNKLLVIPQFRIGTQRLSPNQLSEGTFKTLALLFHIITEDSTGLLIEEPEVCVHHGLLSSILELVKVYSQHKQMVISTHSDYVLDHVTPENVYMVTFDKASGTSVRHIPEAMTAKEYAALRAYLEQEGNLGEYWREAGLGDQP